MIMARTLLDSSCPGSASGPSLWRAADAACRSMPRADPMPHSVCGTTTSPAAIRGRTRCVDGLGGDRRRLAMAGVDGQVTDVVLTQGVVVLAVDLHPVRGLGGGCIGLRPGFPGAERSE